jgi:hypothetical protein
LSLIQRVLGLALAAGSKSAGLAFDFFAIVCYPHAEVSMADMYERTFGDKQLLQAFHREVCRPAFLSAIHHHHMGGKRPGAPPGR